MKRAFNFCAGPCTLPLSVLEEAQAEFVDYHGTGMSLIEMSHRSADYDAVHQETLSLGRTLFAVPDDFEVLLLQGGALLQFAMVPMNLLSDGQTAGYVDSGTWGSAAIKDGTLHGEIYTAWDGTKFDYTRMPRPGEIEVRPDTRYLHVTSNETIGGIRMTEWPEVDVPLVGDMSSDYLTRLIPWDRFDVVYGGAQKNLGPAGATLIFVRRSILEHTNRDMARYLRYDAQADKGSLLNTPPVFAIYMMGKVLRWIDGQGGVAEMERRATERSGILYDRIDSSEGFYRSPVDADHRSLVNVVFRLPEEELEAKFVAEAAAHDLLSLKGHRSVGGIRASIYNAMPLDGVRALVQFMDEFQSANA